MKKEIDPNALLHKNWLEDLAKIDDELIDEIKLPDDMIHEEFLSFMEYFSKFHVIHGNPRHAFKACVEEHEARSRTPLAEGTLDRFHAELCLANANQKRPPRIKKARWEPMVQVKVPAKHLFFSYDKTCEEALYVPHNDMKLAAE